ncbi:MAG: hypothetical protein JAZ19_11075 [Candidatus Thiodiazotropha taylori]|nr:hypothetical protein [Candidatus Thiodiazotropha taylori]
MKKSSLKIMAVLGCSLFAGQAVAESEAPTDNSGNLDFSLKAMHILGDAGNGYDPSEGSSYLIKLKYLTPSWHQAKLGVGFYNAGDLFNLTDFDAAADSDKRLARGMFVTDDGQEKSHMGEFYLNYTRDNFTVNGGRQLYKTPLTTLAYSTMPNFHTAFGVSSDALPGFSISLDQVTQMSFGARAATDYGLIGEATRTAGASFSPVALEQAEFLSVSKAALGTDEDTNGITVLGASYNGIKGTKISVWNYYADDISNTLYVDGNTGFKIQQFKLGLSAQFLTQSDTGDLIEEKGFRGFTDGIDYNLFGLKAVVKGKGWMAFAAFNKSSGDTGMFNSWGGDPAYTSTIFSRNAYRENVSAYKIGVKYNFMKNLFAMLAYANYGESDTLGYGGAGTAAQTDAEEIDLVIVYKPIKDLMLKLFHADRTSEYDGTVDRTQSHTRLIASYKF